LTSAASTGRCAVVIEVWVGCCVINPLFTFV